ncbi:MAG: hypothetical protein PHC49_13695 [Desulfuromonadaceae bacterium]|nr:hypothetical protein [Desulfuromonadaceae bacterium]
MKAGEAAKNSEIGEIGEIFGDMRAAAVAKGYQHKIMICAKAIEGIGPKMSRVKGCRCAPILSLIPWSSNEYIGKNLERISCTASSFHQKQNCR